MEQPIRSIAEWKHSIETERAATNNKIYLIDSPSDFVCGPSYPESAALQCQICAALAGLCVRRAPQVSYHPIGLIEGRISLWYKKDQVSQYISYELAMKAVKQAIKEYLILCKVPETIIIEKSEELWLGTEEITFLNTAYPITRTPIDYELLANEILGNKSESFLTKKIPSVLLKNTFPSNGDQTFEGILLPQEMAHFPYTKLCAELVGLPTRVTLEENTITLTYNKNNEARAKAYEQIYNNVLEACSKELIIRGVPEAIVNNRPPYIGFERYDLDEYASLIPEPLPINWIQIAHNAKELVTTYLTEQENSTQALEESFDTL